jgi:hypothetical protein
LSQIEEIHSLGDIEQAVRIILQTPLLSRVIEVSFDEEVRAKGRWPRRVCSPSTKPLLPFWTTAICDCGNLSGELHAAVWRDAVIVETAGPVRVHHEH